MNLNLLGMATWQIVMLVVLGVLVLAFAIHCGIFIDKNWATDIKINKTRAVHQPVLLLGRALKFCKASKIEEESLKLRNDPEERTAEPVIAPQTPMNIGN